MDPKDQIFTYSVCLVVSRVLSARSERPSSVQAASVVMLADHVGDNMMVEKEPVSNTYLCSFTVF